MARKRKVDEKRNPTTLKVVMGPDEEEGALLARTYTDPRVLAATTLMQYSKQFDGVELEWLVKGLAEQTKAVVDGDLSRAEITLASQAATLDGIFNKLARMAIDCDMLNQLEALLRLALKAQSQSRATWEALAAIKNPPMVGYVRQANIAQGPQQVNNAPAPKTNRPRARENENRQTQLLEQTDGNRLDTGAPSPTGRADSPLETLGEIDRAKVRRG